MGYLEGYSDTDTNIHIKSWHYSANCNPAQDKTGIDVSFLQMSGREALVSKLESEDHLGSN